MVTLYNPVSIKSEGKLATNLGLHHLRYIISLKSLRESKEISLSKKHGRKSIIEWLWSLGIFELKKKWWCNTMVNMPCPNCFWNFAGIKCNMSINFPKYNKKFLFTFKVAYENHSIFIYIVQILLIYILFYITIRILFLFLKTMLLQLILQF